jgi:hypothetical protein
MFEKIKEGRLSIILKPGDGADVMGNLKAMRGEDPLPPLNLMLPRNEPDSILNAVSGFPKVSQLVILISGRHYALIDITKEEEDYLTQIYQ